MRLALLVSLALVLVTSVARAEAPGQIPVVAAPLVRLPPSGPKNPNVALALSLGATMSSYYLVASGDDRTRSIIGGAALLVGPSLGHLYAHHWWTKGLTLRLAGAAVAIEGASLRGSCASLLASCTGLNPGMGVALVLAGSTAIVAGIVWDIARAPAAARAYNRAHDRGVTFGPAAIRGAATTSPGLAFVGRF
jgi:hypothetical protein